MKFPQTLLAIRLFVFPFLFIQTFYIHAQSCTTEKVDERAAAYLEKAGTGLSFQELTSSSIEDIRKKGPKDFVRLSEDSVQRIEITDAKIKVNVVKASKASNLPVIINFHPGGFIKPLLPWMEYEAMRLSKKFNAVVFDVDYRVAPEHQFPAASKDAYAAYNWVLEHATQYGGDPGKIILSGSGAGANLAALTMHKAKKDDKLASIKCLLMICPMLDNPMISYYASYEDNARGYGFTKDESLFYTQTYLDKTLWFMNNPEAWPIYETDLAGLPLSLIVTTEFDVLRDEGIAYGKKLESAGNLVSIKCFPHQLHQFNGLPQDSGEVMRLYELMGEIIDMALAK